MKPPPQNITDKLEAFTDHMNSLPNADAGFSPKEFFTNAKLFGLTCANMCEYFLGKHRAISPGKYPAICPNVLLLQERLATGNVPVKKTAKVPKAAKKTMLKKGEFSQIVSNADPIPDTSLCTYIATPEEIAAA